MKIAVVTFFDRPEISRDPAVVLEHTPLLWHFPQALASRGHDVVVFLHFTEDIEYREKGVVYRFVRPGPIARAVGQAVFSLGRSTTRPRSAGEPAFRLLRALHCERPDVIHLHGTTQHLNLALLHRVIRRERMPLVVQHHGGALTPTRILQPLQRANLRSAARLVVSTPDQGESFVRARAATSRQIAIQMETSSAFQPSSQRRAQQATGMIGRPVFLSAGRLHPIKDPMTMLAGFARIAAVWTDAQLYLHYLTDEMLESMQAWLATRRSIRERVHFRGKLPLSQMEAVYNSADFLLQASLREFSGIAVLDAMACGVQPVVTNLASLRAMTGDGAYGLHFPPGDAASLAERVLALQLDDLPMLRQAIRDHFDRTLSFRRMAKNLESVYMEVIEEAEGSSASSP